MVRQSYHKSAAEQQILEVQFWGIPRQSGKLVDVTGIEPATSCLQSRLGKSLNALSGVAYTETLLNSRSSIVPKLYREFPAFSCSIQGHQPPGQSSDGTGIPYQITVDSIDCRIDFGSGY